MFFIPTSARNPLDQSRRPAFNTPTHLYRDLPSGFSAYPPSQIANLEEYLPRPTTRSTYAHDADIGHNALSAEARYRNALQELRAAEQDYNATLRAREEERLREEQERERVREAIALQAQIEQLRQQREREAALLARQREEVAMQAEVARRRALLERRHALEIEEQRQRAIQEQQARVRQQAIVRQLLASPAREAASHVHDARRSYHQSPNDAIDLRELFAQRAARAHVPTRPAPSERPTTENTPGVEDFLKAIFSTFAAEDSKSPAREEVRFLNCLLYFMVLTFVIQKPAEPTRPSAPAPQPTARPKQEQESEPVTLDFNELLFNLFGPAFAPNTSKTQNDKVCALPHE
jgi:hypothetical protein